MKKSRFTVLAAAVLLALGGGLPAPLSLSPAAPFAVTEAAASSCIDESLRPIRLNVHTHHTVDGDADGVLLRSSVTQVTLVGSAAADGIEALQQTLWNSGNDEMNQAQTIRGKMMDQAKQDRAERRAAGSTFFSAYELMTDVFVRRADTMAVGLMKFSHSYEGGVHGMYGVSGRNYDARTGRPLSLDDVFTDREQLAGVIREDLRRRYPKASFAESGSTFLTDTVDPMLKDGVIPWTLDATGVTFYFNPYLIGSYAEGIFTATVLFDEHPGLFAEKYRRAPAAWCMELRPYIPARVSFADGSRAEVNITFSDGGRRIWCNGVVLDDYGEGSGLRPVLVSLADGRRYLYVDAVDAGDAWETTSVYDLNGAAPVRVPMEHRLTRRADVEEDFTVAERGEPKNDAYADKSFFIMADPENFLMTLLDTATGKAVLCQCRVGADGTPEVIGRPNAQE